MILVCLKHCANLFSSLKWDFSCLSSCLQWGNAFQRLTQIFLSFNKNKWQIGFRNSKELKQWISLPSVNQVQHMWVTARMEDNLLSIMSSLSWYEQVGQSIFIQHSLPSSLWGLRGFRKTSANVQRFYIRMGAEEAWKALCKRNFLLVVDILSSLHMR